MRLRLFVGLAGILMLLASSCSKDSSDGDISRYTVEMCTLTPQGVKAVASCVLDDDRVVRFDKTVSVSWVTKPDSLYRALLYYNKVDDNNAEVFSLQRVLCLTPVSQNDTTHAVKADPLSLVSGWYARNGKFLNLCLGIKTGTIDGNQAHRIAIVTDSLSDHRRYYRLVHDQGRIPAYYTVEAYVSVAVDDVLTGDTVTLDVPTSKGMLRKDFVK